MRKLCLFLPTWARVLIILFTICTVVTLLLYAIFICLFYVFAVCVLLIVLLKLDENITNITIGSFTIIIVSYAIYSVSSHWKKNQLLSTKEKFYGLFFED